MPLVKLRRENPAFQFYFNSKTVTTVIPRDAEEHMDDSIDRIEASMREWDVQPLVFRPKSGFKRTIYVEEQ
jgi:hypothetical protein